MLERKSPAIVSVVVFMSFIFSACSSNDAATTSSGNELAVAMVKDLDPQVADCVLQVETEAAEGSEQEQTLRIEELIKSCEEVNNPEIDQEQETEETPDKLAFARSLEYGDDETLDALWDKCEQGSGESCDELFSNSPIGSEYEKFGVSCGERATVLHCSELDKEDTKLVPKAAQTSTTEAAEDTAE